MTFLQFKKIARWSGLRAALLGAMGLVTLLNPEFLKGSIIYAVAAYGILNGILSILDFLSGRSKEEKHIAYINLAVTVAAILFSRGSISRSFSACRGWWYNTCDIHFWLWRYPATCKNFQHLIIPILRNRIVDRTNL